MVFSKISLFSVPKIFTPRAIYPINIQEGLTVCLFSVQQQEAVASGQVGY